MPLIVICGYPSSGKTFRAGQIVQYFNDRAMKLDVNLTGSAASGQRSLRVHHISDHSLHLPRTVYSTAKAEKDARGALYAAVKRVLGENDIVILDSGNYIKGWRYQLHCEAKAVSTPSCVVHVGTPVETARGLDEERRAILADVSREAADAFGKDEPYGEQLFEELVVRFEEPNAMTRWDSPLFTVPWDDTEPPLAELWNVMVDTEQGIVDKKSMARPSQATILIPASAPDHLYELDRATQGVVTRIQEYQRDHPGETGVSVPIQLEEPVKEKVEAKSVRLPVSLLTFAQLQRMRRQFIALHRQQMGSGGMSGVGHGAKGLIASRVGGLFIDWLNDQFERET